ncbi:MAG: hypothetical protein IAE67_04380 [Candidatus Competibacteraceae bacterium]|nr:hypothetical protein [Candidatus Competibacteraceae bacterium]
MSNAKPFLCFSLPVLLYAMAVAVMFLCVRGYDFNAGDQAEHLPLVYKAMDSSLYTHDYFVTASEQTFTVRYMYVHVVTFFSRLMGVPAAVFLLTLICLMMSAWAFWAIAYMLSGNCIAGYLAPWMVMFVFYNYFSLGTDLIQGNMLVSGSFGLALSAVSIALFLMKKFRIAFFILGIAGLFHVMFSFNLFLLLFVGYLFFYRSKHEWILLLCIYLVVSVSVLLPVVLRQTSEAYIYDKDLYYQIQFVFRNYHHFMPSLFKTSHYIKFFGLTFTGVILLLFLPVRDKKFVFYFYAMVIFGFAVYALCLEVLGWMFAGKTQWPKGTTIWASMFSAILFSIAKAEVLTRWIRFGNNRIIIALSSIIVFVFGIAVITQHIVLPNHYAARYKVGNYPKDTLYNMHSWIRENTPVDAVFLVPATNDRFGCEAKRSAITGYRAIVHEPFFIMPWFETFCLVYHVTLNDGLQQNVYDILDYRYHTFNVKSQSEHELHIDFRLVDMSKCKYLDELGNPLHVEGSWGLYAY